MAKNSKTENYIKIYDFMVDELDLSGNELVIYALIYGFTQSDERGLKGNIQYIADRVNITKRSVITLLSSLAQKSYIERIETYPKGVVYRSIMTANEVKKFHLSSEKISLKEGKNFTLTVKKFHSNGEKISSDEVKKFHPRNKYKEINKEINIELKGEVIEKVSQVGDLFNRLCPSLPPISFISNEREQAIKAMLKKYDAEQFKRAFEKAEASSFLTGENHRGWKASIDWLMNESNFVKVLDGNYDDWNGSDKENDVSVSYDLQMFEERANALPFYRSNKPAEERDADSVAEN